MEKWPILDQNHGLTPLKTYQLIVFFYTCKGVFLLQNIIKHIFLTQTAFKKKEGKMARFGPKPWTNPFGEISIFRLFQLFVFIAQKGVFLLQNITKHIFLTQIVLKKREKWPILDQHHGLTPLDKSQFFDFFNVLFLCPRKAFFCSRIS